MIPGAGDGERCRLCGDALLPAFTGTERMFGLGGAFDYGRCVTCRSLSLTTEVDVSDFYPPDYYSVAERFADPAVVGLRKRAAAILLRRPRLVGALMHTPLAARIPAPVEWFAGSGVGLHSRVLDVGSGNGHVLRDLRWLGFENLTGIDPFLGEAEVTIGPVRITRSALGDVGEAADVVMFHHVLEHLPDPVGDLRTARHRLPPDGVILVRVPLADSEACAEYGPDWVQLDPPRHVNVPTSAGLDAAAERAGLRVTAGWRDSTAFQFWGSEQYRLGIPLRDPASTRSDDTGGPFGAERIDGWRKRARKLNRTGRGDQGVFLLRPS